MHKAKIELSSLVALPIAGLIIAVAVFAGCRPEQPQSPQKPSEGTGTATQSAPYVDASCYVEGALVPPSCGLGYPTCPAEDSQEHAGQPCFWVDPDGRGLLWSDGVAAAGQ